MEYDPCVSGRLDPSPQPAPKVRRKDPTIAQSYGPRPGCSEGSTKLVLQGRGIQALAETRVGPSCSTQSHVKLQKLGGHHLCDLYNILEARVYLLSISLLGPQKNHKRWRIYGTGPWRRFICSVSTVAEIWGLSWFILDDIHCVHVYVHMYKFTFFSKGNCPISFT